MIVEVQQEVRLDTNLSEELVCESSDVSYPPTFNGFFTARCAPIWPTGRISARIDRSEVSERIDSLKIDGVVDSHS